MKSLFKYLLTVFVFILSANFATAQRKVQNTANENTTDSIKQHSPKRAALYSAIIPGWGQAYNKKYWKIPVIYAGAGVLIYFIRTFNQDYERYSDAYRNYDSPGPTSFYDYAARGFAKSDMETARDYSRKYRDMNCILLGLLYGLNIVDATVDAQFFNFDVSPSLSMKIEPAVTPIALNMHEYSGLVGLKLKLKFMN